MIKYKTIIITGLTVLDDIKHKLINYINAQSVTTKAICKTFEELNYYISEIKFNRRGYDMFEYFSSNTLIVWLDSTKIKNKYAPAKLFNTEINTSRTTVKLLSGIDNIYFDTEKDDYFITIIPTIKKLINAESDNERELILTEFS